MGIYKVENIWYIDYYYEGRRIREPASKSKTEAAEMLEARKTDIVRGEFHLPGKRKIKFEKFAQEYLEYAKINKRSWERDRVILGHLMPHFKGMALSKINPKHIEDNRDHLLFHLFCPLPNKLHFYVQVFSCFVS